MSRQREAVTDDPQFDYVAVDSSGAESTVETVTVDTEEPQLYNVVVLPVAANRCLLLLASKLLIGDGETRHAWLDSALDQQDETSLKNSSFVR
ncbi:hypothetical protein O9992_16655 [Vibrio lentus]|nr:hypothetical protein [Vibrio lentus]